MLMVLISKLLLVVYAQLYLLLRHARKKYNNVELNLSCIAAIDCFFSEKPKGFFLSKEYYKMNVNKAIGCLVTEYFNVVVTIKAQYM